MDPGNGVCFCSFTIKITEEKLMVKINPRSINDLLSLKAVGVPVTLTSHPGNASLYKLVLWTCGIPEHLWDVTCCKADTNNWPMYRLINGQAELLVTTQLHRRIMVETNPSRRFITAYQLTAGGSRLGRVHVKAMQANFPDISSCSRLLLSEKERVREVFEYLAATCRENVFPRYINPDGTMHPWFNHTDKPEAVADAFIHVLEELDHLLFSDEPITTQGGPCYDGAMVPLSGMLVQFWQSGRLDRYDISGPDMIHYALRPEHQRQLSDMLQHLRKWNANLVPENFIVQMFPGTVARVGYIPAHISQAVMQRKQFILRQLNSLGREQKRLLWEDAKDDENFWPTQINPSAAPYFSQYDLTKHGGKIIVDDFWRELPFDQMKDTLYRANAMLRLQ